MFQSFRCVLGAVEVESVDEDADEGEPLKVLACAI